MSQPTSRPLAPEYKQAPLDRTVIVRTMPLARAILAVVCWINSALTSALCGAWIESQLTNAVTPWYGLGGQIAVGIAVLLSFAQVYTRQARHFGGYTLAVVPDLGTTAIQWTLWINPALRTLLGDVPGWTVAIVIATGIGWFSARWPEQALFGD